MSVFTADWLALREPADSAARSPRLTQAVVRAIERASSVARDGLSILDLAAGTGANARYLAGRLPPEQRWLFVDHDSALLEAAAARMMSWRAAHPTCSVETRRLDLNGAVDGAHLFAGRALVTASALLDLVSDRWLRLLVERCRESRAAVLFTLTYDGRIACLPREPEDDEVCGLVNRHQRSDKGFGAALGPDSADRAFGLLVAAGYLAEREPSDWNLDPDARDLQGALIAGWAEAASAVAPHRSATIADWRARRLAHVDARHSRIVVGHVDLAAWLAD